MFQMYVHWRWHLYSVNIYVLIYLCVDVSKHVLRLPKKFEINCKKLESTTCNLKLILPNKSLTCVSLQ